MPTISYDECILNSHSLLADLSPEEISSLDKDKQQFKFKAGATANAIRVLSAFAKEHYVELHAMEIKITNIHALLLQNTNSK